MEAIRSGLSRALNVLSTMGVADILDILIVAYIIYKAIWFVRRTNSYNVAKGILVILVALLLSYVFDLRMIYFLLSHAVEIGLLALEVLSPTRKGELGTVSLNKRLQEALNPPAEGKKEKLFGELVFRVGDRVTQVKNNYDMLWRSADNKLHGTGVYNGDIGRIAAMDYDSETLTVDFDGRLADYGFEALPELEHAWAMTVHKAQGSEYRAVILCLAANAQMLMTRDVLYTAVTRARELLILVGDDSTAYRMIDNFRQTRRFSALRLRLLALSGL